MREVCGMCKHWIRLEYELGKCLAKLDKYTKDLDLACEDFVRSRKYEVELED